MGLFIATIQQSLDSGTTYTNIQSGQADVVATAYSCNINVSALVKVSQPFPFPVFRITITNPSFASWIHFNATSASIWEVYRIGWITK